jgi:uncharacterized membrane protein YcaP (DUF421 family)
MDIDWGQLFQSQVPVLETVVRGTVVYWFLFLLFRFILRRDIGSIGVADILLVVLIADAAQNAMSGGYKTITDGLILIATIAGWNYLIDWLNYKFPALRPFMEANPLCLIRNGRILAHNLRKEFLSREELMAKLRERGYKSIDEIDEAFLESDGEVSVIPKERAKRRPAKREKGPARAKP